MTRISPTVGRVVLCFRPDKWDKPMPGIVAGVYGEGPDARTNVFVLINQDNAPTQLLQSVPVLDPIVPKLTPEQIAGIKDDTERAALEKASVQAQLSERRMAHDRWAEWMPYQTGQAAKTEDVAGKLAERIGNLSEIVGNLQLELAAATAKIAELEEAATK